MTKSNQVALYMTYQTLLWQRRWVSHNEVHGNCWFCGEETWSYTVVRKTPDRAGLLWVCQLCWDAPDD